METTNRRSEIDSYIEDQGDWTMFAEGFDDAIVGIEPVRNRVVYSVSKCYEILQSRDKMTLEEADEYFSFNVLGSFVGEKTPIWVVDRF